MVGIVQDELDKATANETINAEKSNKLRMVELNFKERKISKLYNYENSGCLMRLSF